MRPDFVERTHVCWDWLPQDWTTEPKFYNVDTWADNEIMQSAHVRKAYDRVCENLDALLAKYGCVRENNYYRIDEENKSIMKTAMKQLFPVKNIATPYMYHHIVEALFEAGLKEEAIHLMKSYWGKMISLGADTYWEAFDPDQPNYSPYGSPIVNSYCHAWSCTPVYLIKEYLV